MSTIESELLLPEELWDLIVQQLDTFKSLFCVAQCNKLLNTFCMKHLQQYQYAGLSIMTSCRWRAAAETNARNLAQKYGPIRKKYHELCNSKQVYNKNSTEVLETYIVRLLLETGPIINHRQQLIDGWSSLTNIPDKELFNFIPHGVFIAAAHQDNVKWPKQCLFVATNGERCPNKPARQVGYAITLCCQHQKMSKTLDVGVQIKWSI